MNTLIPDLPFLYSAGATYIYIFSAVLMFAIYAPYSFFRQLFPESTFALEILHTSVSHTSGEKVVFASCDEKSIKILAKWELIEKIEKFSQLYDKPVYNITDKGIKISNLYGTLRLRIYILYKQIEKGYKYIFPFFGTIIVFFLYKLIDKFIDKHFDEIIKGIF